MLFTELEQKVLNDKETYVDILGKTQIHIDKINHALNQFKKVNPEITEQDLKDTLGRKWRASCLSMLPLVTFINKSSRKKPVMLSCKLFGYDSKDLTERAINNLINLNVIKCIQDFYSADQSLARVYQVYWSRFDCLYSLLREYTNICEKLNNLNDKINVKEEEYIDIEEDKDNQNINRDQSSLRLALQDLIKRQNALQTSHMFRYYLKADSGRAYAPICSIPTIEKHSRNEYPVVREDVISNYFREYTNICEKYNNNIKEYDRSNSIYKLNNYILRNKILSNNRDHFDLYTELLGNNKVSNGRSLMKLLTMTLYFSDARKFRSLVEHWVDYYVDNDFRARHIAQKGRERVWTVIQLLGLNKKGTTVPTRKELVDLCVQWFKDTREKLRSLIGEFVGKEIFIYENIVNLYTEIQIREAGYNCVSVYDGFYTDCSEDFWWNCYKNSLEYLRTLINTKGEEI